MGSDEALEVMLENPAVLQCGPSLEALGADEIRAFAALLGRRMDQRIEVPLSLENLVLGDIYADFCKQILHIRWKALHEIYMIYIFLYRSDFNSSSRTRL